MSFAKQAADALVNEDAEGERQETHDRWKKYLAAAAGLGGLGLGGYLAYKNWPGISHAIDKATGSLPDEGLVKHVTGYPGAMAGAAMGAVIPEIQRLTGATKANSIAGLTNASRSANEKSPIGRAIDDLKTRFGGAGKDAGKIPGSAPNLHAAFAPAMANPTGKPGVPDPLVQIANIGQRGSNLTSFSNPENYSAWDPRAMWSHVKSRQEMGGLLRGLDKLHNKPDLSPELGKALQERFGNDLGQPGNLREALNYARQRSTSALPLGSRALKNGVLGAGLGYGLDKLTEQPVP